jgi:hypothetical protein
MCIVEGVLPLLRVRAELEQKAKRHPLGPEAAGDVILIADDELATARFR